LPGPKEDQGVLSIQILPEETHHLADVQSASLSGATSGPFLFEFLGENTVWCIQKNGQVLRDEKDENIFL